jgi:hypothetical protein
MMVDLPRLVVTAVLLTAIGRPAVAREDTAIPPVLSPPDTWLPRQSGTVRVLNKLDSTLQSLTIHVGETAHVRSLSIKLAACAVRPPDLPADAAAHLTVTDSRPDAPGFDGWILQNEPAANMLEHPVYDIQLASCT